MWSAPVGTAESFDHDLAVLLPKYSELPDVVTAFMDALAHNVKLTRIPLDDGSGQDDFQGLFAQLLDYPPLGEMGIQLFRVTYHAPPKHEANPWQRFTLLTIVERQPQADAEARHE
jgi:hypothetical protein